MANTKRQLTAEEKALILADYQNREIKVHDIPKKYGISLQKMQKTVLEMGAELRVPKKSKTSKMKFKICSNCKKIIEIKGAKFCPFCASDLRSEKELLVEKVENLKELYSYLPETERDNFIKILCDVNLFLLKEN